MSQPIQTQSKPLDDSFVLTLPDEPSSGRDWHLWAGVLALLVFVAFFPAATGTFLWDDDHHVGLISALHLESLEGLARIWTPRDASPQYYPLTFTTFWLEHHVFGDSPLGYHIDNLLLHAGTAVLLWRLLRQLKIPGAWIAAAIWAVHPLQVESVCWISERKNVLSGLLFFTSIWFYAEYAGLADGLTARIGNKQVAYALSLLVFILALFAKTVACAMPAAMLIILWWKGRKLNSKSIVPLIPFFLAGLILAIVTVYLESAPGGNVEANGPDWNLTFVQRLLIASRGVWFYVVKLIWPAQLTFSYPRVVPDPGNPVEWLYVIGIFAALAALWIGRSRWGRAPLAATLYYGVTLFPALGFFNIFPMRYSFVADHFQYLSGVGLIVLAVGAVNLAMRRVTVPRGAMATIAGVLVAALMIKSNLQAQIYQSPLTLWSDTLTKNPDSWMAADNLGIELIKEADRTEQQAALEQRSGDTTSAKADSEQAKGDFSAAEELFNRVLKIRPQNYLTYNSLGQLYLQTARWQDAENALRTAVEMDENDLKGHQLTAPYINYAAVMTHNHPGMDVRPWLDKALALSDQPRVSAGDVAMVHFAYGDYWLSRFIGEVSTTSSSQQRTDLNHSLDEYKTGLATLSTSAGALFNAGRICQQLGLLDQQESDRAKAAGHLDQAQALQQQRWTTDDDSAIKYYLAATDNTPNHRHALALEGIGELLVDDARQAQSQSDAVIQWLKGLSFFQNSLDINPDIPGAKDNLKRVAAWMTQEGKIAAGHKATWALLSQQLSAITHTPLTPATATSLDQAARNALWPLPQDHSLRQPLFDLRLAIQTYLSPHAPADAADHVHETASTVLKSLAQRDQATDSVNDLLAAATCYAGALTAQPDSPQAWQTLAAATQDLQNAMAAKSGVPNAQKTLDEVQNVLDQHRAATQPAAVPAQ